MAQARLSLLLLSAAVSCLFHVPVAKASLSVIINQGLECNKTLIADRSIIGDEERADICLEACKKIQELVDSSKTDKKTESCRSTAYVIDKLFSYLGPSGSAPAGFPSRIDVNGVTKIQGLGEAGMQAEIKKLMDHKDGCFLDMHIKWMWRDFICASDANTLAGADEQRQSAARRFALDFLPYYHDGDKDKKVFCFPTLLRILSERQTNLFQSGECMYKGNQVHPLWTKFEDNTCDQKCKDSVLEALKLATQSEEGVDGNAECCAALYYDHAFAFMFKSGEALELSAHVDTYIGDGCDKNKMPCTKLEKAVEKCIGADAFKPYRKGKCHSALH